MLFVTTTALGNGIETRILAPEAIRFLTRLSREFEPRRQELLARRRVRQKQIDAGELPDFLAETARIRAKEWTVARTPQDLLDLQVEITDPLDRKMNINGLHSGANVFMAVEDSPTWQNNLEGQANLCDVVAGTINSPAGGQALRAQFAGGNVAGPASWLTFGRK